MALYFIGLGLNDQKDVSIKGFDAIKKCDVIYLESYTAQLHVSKDELEKFYGKKIILADRLMVEQHSYEIIGLAEKKDVAFLVVGDIFGATTHVDLLLQARKKNIACHFIHNASILNAVGIVGLALYKYGQVTSIPFSTESYNPSTPYDVIKSNLEMNLHSLVLFDLKPLENRFMTVNDAIRRLLEIESEKKENVFTEDTVCVGCARIGGEFTIKYGKAKDLLKHDFGKPMHCLIVPAKKLHFIEEEALEIWR